jgi:adenylate kinase family enzyme
MMQVAVIGNAGGGKTTMCRKIGARLNLPVHHVDMIQWQPGWQRTPLDDFRRVHDDIMAQDRWIIDGFGPMDAIAKRFELADTIIVVDYPIAIHYWWSAKRQIKCIFRPRDDVPENCPMVPKTMELIRVMWRVHTEIRPQFLALAEKFQNDKRVIRLRSPGEMKQLVRQIEQRGDYVPA